MTVRIRGLVLLAALPWLVPGPFYARDLATLRAEIEAAAQEAGGTVGVGVRHLGSGEELYVNGGRRYPMGSLFKVPLAVEVLSRVDQGTLSLDRTLPVQASDLRPGSGKLVKGFGGSAQMSVRALLETTLIDSDNTATDILWREVGGSPPVMARLARLEVKGINVARPTGQLLAAAIGLEAMAGNTDVTPARLEEMIRQVPRNRRLGEIAAFLKDERDTTTPEAYVALLSRIAGGDALSPASNALLLDIMHRCATGRARLRAGLPFGARLAHKTGTLTPMAVNDAGILALPNGARVVIVVLVRESAREVADKERAIAGIARAVYRHYAS